MTCNMVRTNSDSNEEEEEENIFKHEAAAKLEVILETSLNIQASYNKGANKIAQEASK